MVTPLLALVAAGAIGAPGLVPANLRLDEGALASLADPPAPGDLDFDLLGEPEKPPPEDPGLRRRRAMLGVHRKLGLGLVSLQLGTTVVGQLNYSDRFGDANTGKWGTTHQVLAYSTLAVFAAQGLLGVLAPDAPRKAPRGARVTAHRIAMFTAAALMAGQAGLGIWTARREGYVDKQDFGRAHLAVGYATLAAVATGVTVLAW